MARLLPMAMLSILAAFMGCSHVRVVAASNARVQGDEIHTKYRYRPVLKDGTDLNSRDLKSAAVCNMHLYESYQPDVFSADGIPITLAFSDGLNEGYKQNVLNGLFSLCTFYVIPMFSSEAHSHHNCQVSVGGIHIASVEVCYKRDSVGSLLPLSLLFYNGDGDTCFSGGQKLTLHGSSSDMRLAFGEAVGNAMAYGIASRLKEAEDAGKINEQLATLARSEQSLSAAATTRTRAASEDLVRRGITLPDEKTRVGQSFEIISCDNEKGKDFAYSFALRKSGGSAMTIADLGDMRSAFRSAIRTHYESSHPGVNSRALAVYFTEYGLKNGVVVGRVVVLTITPESLSYDPASRRGVIKVRIGEGQFEDARRWIRSNLVSFVNENNAAIGGNAIPKESRFYSESEELKNGVLVVSFKME